MLYEKNLKPGEKDSFILSKNKRLRITALDGNANVSALFFNAHMPIERYNMADTLKGQHTAKLSTGNCLYSDMGHSLCSIIEDTCGWHDPLCGVTNAVMTEDKYGKTSYQKDRNQWYKNGRDNFIIEVSKYGLGIKDIVANINFFSKVVADDNGNISLIENHCQKDMYITLRMDMDVLVVLSNTPHPLDLSEAYNPRPVMITVLSEEPVPAADVCTRFCAENERAHTNTRIYNTLASGANV